MAVANSIVKQTYGAPEKHILIANDSYLVTLGAIVANTGISADSNGKKILKAGTPLYGNIEKRDTAFVKATQTDAAGDNPASNNATAVLLHDVDVTDGDNNATIILAGCVDLLKLESAVKAMITAEAKAALPRIIFVEGSAI